MRYRQHLLYCRTVRYGAPKITITQMVCSVPFHRKPTKMEGSALEKKPKFGVLFAAAGSLFTRTRAQK